MYRKLYKYGIVAYLLLVIMAVFFYKERTIFVDIAYHLFCILKDNSFAIQNFRFGSIVTQSAPLLSAYLGLPLNTILIVYSTWFAVYYFICYVVCGSLLRQYELALVLLMANILFVTDTFYWIQSELPQGLAFMIVVFSLLRRSEHNISNVASGIFILIGLVATAFFHPLLLFPFLFVTGYHLIGKKFFSISNKQLLAVILLYGIALVLKTFVFATPYDHSSFGSLKNLVTLFPDYLNIPTNKYFLSNILTQYYWIPITTIVILIFYAVQKQWLKAALFFTSVAGYILLINISYAHVPARELFYVENLYLPLGIIIAVPLVFELIPNLYNKSKLLPVVLLSAIIISGAIRIYSAHTPFTNRLNWERSFLAKYRNEKLLIDATRVPSDTLLMTWGTAFEFWLLSTIEYGNSASIIITDSMHTREWAAKKTHHFIDQWHVTPYSELPEQYFRFTDSASAYKVVK